MNSADALILREALSAVAPMSSAQSIACDVISENRPPELDPDPSDPAGRCSMVDAAVMARTGAALDPGVTPVCPLGALAQCFDEDDSDGDGFAGYPTEPGCASANDSDETDDCPNGPACPACANTLDEDLDELSDYPADSDCSAAGDTTEGEASGAPLAPTALAAIPGNTQATLSWTVDANSGPGTSDHLVITRLANGAFVAWSFTGSGSGAYVVTGLENGTSYSFQVRSINSVGIGAISASSNSVIPAGAPDPPATPSTVRTPNTGASIDVSWSAPADNGSPISDYEIEVSATGIDTFTTTSIGVAALSKTIGGLVTCNYGQASQNCNRAYRFRVRARNGVNYGAYSALSSSLIPAVSYAVDHVASIWPQCTACHGSTLLPNFSVNAFENARNWNATTLYGPPSSAAYNMCGIGPCITSNSSEYRTLQSWQNTGELP